MGQKHIDDKEIIKKLRRWSKTNNPAYLAWRVGVRSTVAIDNWMYREKVPSWHKESVLNVITKERSEQ